MRSVNRIVKVNESRGYRLSLLFNNGESRVVDFETLFKKWKITNRHIAYSLTQNAEEFKKFKLMDGTLVWENIKFSSEDEKGIEVVQYFDLDPIVLYQNSTKDLSRSIQIGMMIRKARKELGITQEELAKKSGTTKHYISRIENDKSGIEMMTLKKIVEGLGKRLQISIN